MTRYEEYLKDSLYKISTLLNDSNSRPILFVGAGISRRYIKSPNWIGLLEYLIEANSNKKYPIGYYTQERMDNLPQVGSLIATEYYDYAWEKHSESLFPKELYSFTHSRSIFLKHRISEHLISLINDFFIENHPYNDELEALAQITPHVVITTNYDLLMEHIFPNHSPIIGQQVIRARESTNYGHLLKIHGCVSQPSEIVISNEDYSIFMEKQKYLIAKLLTYFMEYPIIFLGYALADENIKSILSDVSEIIKSDDDEPVSNIWFIEWQENDISSDAKPSTDKVVDLGNGKTIRINYLLVNSFTELFKSLQQDINKEPVNIIRELENNVYNIVKSKTFTNLAVDRIDFKAITDINTLAKHLGFEAIQDMKNTEKVNVAGLGNLTNPEQLLLQYPYSLNDVAINMGLDRWQYLNPIIKTIEKETGYKIKQETNRYHVDREQGSGRAANHRYSQEAIELFTKVLENKSYEIYDILGNLIASTQKEIEGHIEIY
ncbi:SIR2 family NAD-dependent protein deacylase [Paenibacillus wenxiniae]|uniref:SIR2 family protein n=1 Tax=Paenibacillus wenxiniae TaxID=1636843 RepID=A0ABW4RGR9_9BACL